MDHPLDSVHVLKHVAQTPKEGEYILWACTWRPAYLEEYHIELKITCGHRSSSNTMWSSNTMLFWDNKRLRFRHCLLHTGTMSEAEVFSSWYMQNVEPLWAHDLHDYCWSLRWRVIVCPSPSSPKMIWLLITSMSTAHDILCIINGNRMKHQSLLSRTIGSWSRPIITTIISPIPSKSVEFKDGMGLRLGSFFEKWSMTGNHFISWFLLICTRV